MLKKIETEPSHRCDGSVFHQVLLLADLLSAQRRYICCTGPRDRQESTIYMFFKNALYPLYASYTSALLVISHGACMHSTATPLSMTSMP